MSGDLPPAVRAAVRERAKQLAAEFPPLTGEQLAELRDIFRPAAQTKGPTEQRSA